MRIGYFTDRGHRPSPEEIRRALGSRYPLWERLTQFIDDNFKVTCQLSFWGPAKSGWNLRCRAKGKASVALYPQKERIMAQVVLGKEEAEMALTLKLGEEVARILAEAPQLHDGRWLFIPVLGENDVEDVERLLLLKTRPVPWPRSDT